jgi:hypothetical protein
MTTAEEIMLGVAFGYVVGSFFFDVLSIVKTQREIKELKREIEELPGGRER